MNAQGASSQRTDNKNFFFQINNKLTNKETEKKDVTGSQKKQEDKEKKDDKEKTDEKNKKVKK